MLGNLGSYWDGMRMTVVLTVLAFGLAMAVGTIVAAFRVSPVPPLRGAGAVWVEGWRNTPLILLFFLFFFGLPKVGILFSASATAVLVLGLYTSAFIAETIRAGINSVHRGQAEAARSIGLTFPQTLRIVILPQAFRTVVGPLASLLIALTKNTSVASVISVLELTEVADRLNTATARPVAVFLGAGIAYFALTFPTGLAAGWLERRVAIKR